MTYFLHPCTKPGCYELTRQPYCPAHTRPPAPSDQRASSPRRGYGRLHAKWRKIVLGRQPFCAGWPRGAPKCTEVATIADHIVPKDAPDRATAMRLAMRLLTVQARAKLAAAPSWRTWLALSVHNGQGLCQGCHNRKTGEGL